MLTAYQSAPFPDGGANVHFACDDQAITAHSSRFGTERFLDCVQIRRKYIGVTPAFGFLGMQGVLPLVAGTLTD